jgi:short-subunit dehydrogenase
MTTATAQPTVAVLDASTGAPKTALVTGASSGIGAAIATELARRGRSLTLVAHRPDRLREVAARIGSEHDVRVEWIAMDLSDAAERDRLPGEIAARGLVVDLLVNNAGVGTMGLFHQIPAAEEIQLVRINVEAVVALCAAFVPGMVQRGAGAVLNVSSVSGFMPVPKQSTYSASKAFVLTFTEALTLDLHGTGVTATALCPGPVKTNFGGLIQNLPDALFVEPERVAREALDAVERGHRTVVPGVANRFNAISGRYAPRGLFLSFARRFWPT